MNLYLYAGSIIVNEISEHVVNHKPLSEINIENVTLYIFCF